MFLQAGRRAQRMWVANDADRESGMQGHSGLSLRRLPAVPEPAYRTSVDLDNAVPVITMTSQGHA